MSVALVTGGSRGIGFAIVKELVSCGFYVIASARKNSTDLDNLIEEKGEFLSFIPCDISKKGDRDSLFANIVKEHGKIDLIVNNAGIGPAVRKDILEITEVDYDYVTDVNLKGTFFMAQAAGKIMLKQGAGRIVNISSISSYTASTDRAEYCIAKAGISMTTKLFCARLSEFGIGVFEIMPGIIETDMTAAVKEKYEKLIKDGITPIKRLGLPSDIASVVKAIALGLLDFCTGTVISADGGFGVRRL